MVDSPRLTRAKQKEHAERDKRLARALRDSGLAMPFSRKVSLRSVGDNTRRDVEAYIDDDLVPLLAACDAADLAAFERAFSEAVDAANDYHRRWNKGFLVWKVPQTPPEDLVLEPQG